MGRRHTTCSRRRFDGTVSQITCETDMTTLTQTQLKELLRYDANTGHFYWLQSRGCAKKDQKAGARDAYGYIVIRVNNHLYKAHRLAWLYVYGRLPIGLLDHKNRKTDDNRIANLREVSQLVNMHNAKTRVGSRSNVPGVRWREERNSWVASIRISYKMYHLGSFKTLEEAIRARKNAERKMLSSVYGK